jgi:hypothetical protein
LQSPVMINRRKRNVLASWIKQTYCNRNEHGFLNGLPWSWWYLLTAEMSPSNILSEINNQKYKSMFKYSYPDQKVQVCIPNFQSKCVSFCIIRSIYFNNRSPSLRVPVQ